MRTGDFLTDRTHAFRHFSDPTVVYDILEEILCRHGRSYETVLDEIVTQLRDYYRESFSDPLIPARFRLAGEAIGRPRFLVGLSGGLDSTVVTYLAARAMGPEAVLPVTMPLRAEEDCIGLAALVRRELGFDDPDAPYLLNLEPIASAYIGLMDGQRSRQLQVSPHEGEQATERLVRLGNLGSRLRIAILYDFQRAMRGRILGTLNRTEFCQGFGTKFGAPLAYDFGVINSLYKVEVLALAGLLHVPSRILSMPHSSCSFPGQTHESDLGAAIEEQDAFAYLLFERHLDPASIATRYGASEEFGRLMLHRYHLARHKQSVIASQASVHIR